VVVKEWIRYAGEVLWKECEGMRGLCDYEKRAFANWTEAGWEAGIFEREMGILKGEVWRGWGRGGKMCKQVDGGS
jgi:hypothetical protein